MSVGSSNLEGLFQTRNLRKFTSWASESPSSLNNFELISASKLSPWNRWWPVKCFSVVSNLRVQDFKCFGNGEVEIILAANHSLALILHMNYCWQDNPTLGTSRRRQEYLAVSPSRKIEWISGGQIIYPWHRIQRNNILLLPCLDHGFNTPSFLEKIKLPSNHAC